VDELRELYEARAAQQYAEPTPLPDPRIDRKFRRICELVREQLPCEAFLDAGCGDGRYLAALAPELPDRRTGLDISARILETAARRIDADYRQAGLGALPFEDGAFDLVLCTQVIEHVPDAPAGIGELVRVLRPGGRLVISTDNQRNLVTRWLNAPRTLATGALRLHGARGRIESPATPYTPESFRALLEGASLRVERLETFRFHLMWPLALPPVMRALNWMDERSQPHEVGDIVVAVAQR
jgi:ubiquinone/menaquinone biosynthesis C-methylase UbiE